VSLLSIFGTAILPVVLVAAVGYALGRAKGVEPDALNTVTVYVLAPALVVHSLATTPLGGGTIGRIVAAVVAATLALLAIGWVAARAAGVRGPVRNPLVLVTAFPNVGNYGIPLAAFAFGATGRSTAVLVTAVQGVLLYTIGVYVAASGEASDPRTSIRRALGVPLVYAVVVALVARWLGVVPPADSVSMEFLGLVGDSAIPVMLLVLGLQLADVTIDRDFGTVGLGSALKLLVAPVVALGVVWLAGFGDLTVARSVVLLMGAPTAVTTIILVGEFGESEDAELVVSASVLVTTVASVLTVTALVSVLQSGVVL
jgi:predicted permease